MVYLRWCITPFVLAGAFLIGGIISLVLEHEFRIWYEYGSAVIIPTIGLYGVYIMAPNFKFLVACVSAIVGLFAAFYVAYPSFYPERHSSPYQITYIPFIVVCLVTSGHLWLLGFTRVKSVLNI